MALTDDIKAALATNDLPKARELTRAALRALRERRKEAVESIDSQIKQAEDFLAATREAAHNQDRARRMLAKVVRKPALTKEA